MDVQLDFDCPEYQRLRDLLVREYGVRLIVMERAIVERQLREFCAARELTSIADCVRFLESDRSRIAEIADFVYSRSTRFNRDPAHFAFLVDQITAARQRTAGADPWRIWSVGCSTGQEAYSIAIHLLEYAFLDDRAAASFHVTGSDCSMSALHRAERGVYPLDDVRRLEPIPFTQYVVAAGGDDVAMAPEVRRRVSFSPFNLVTSPYPPPGSVDAVFMRNVLDFHTVTSQQIALTKLRTVIKPGGWLVLGEMGHMTTATTLDVAALGYAQEAPGCFRAIPVSADTRRMHAAR